MVQALGEMTASYRALLNSIGEDANRPGLLRTPERAAKAFLYFTKGYDEKIAGQLKISFFRKTLQIFGREDSESQKSGLGQLKSGIALQFQRK